MNRFEYPVLLTPAEEGGFVVTCRDLPQLVTQGDDEPDALVQVTTRARETVSINCGLAIVESLTDKPGVQ